MVHTCFEFNKLDSRPSWRAKVSKGLVILFLLIFKNINVLINNSILRNEQRIINKSRVEKNENEQSRENTEFQLKGGYQTKGAARGQINIEAAYNGVFFRNGLIQSLLKLDWNHNLVCGDTKSCIN